MQDEIIFLALNPDWTPAQIHRELLERQEEFKDIPTVRTVERIVKERRTLDASGPWSLADNDGDEIRLILEVRRVLIENFGHDVHRFSKEEAAWVLKIRRLAEDLDTYIAWIVALMYSSHLKAGLSTASLDDYLTFTPWRSGEESEKYQLYVDQGLVERPPLWDKLMDFPFDPDEEIERRTQE